MHKSIKSKPISTNHNKIKNNFSKRVTKRPRRSLQTIPSHSSIFRTQKQPQLNRTLHEQHFISQIISEQHLSSSKSLYTTPQQSFSSLSAFSDTENDEHYFFPQHDRYKPLTHLKFSHRPRVITLDITGTLLTPKQSIAQLYSISAAKVGIQVDNQELLSKCFKKAYVECTELYPNFGHGQMPSSRHWWYQVVKKTFTLANYNMPYQQQDALFDQIYSDFGLFENYHVYNDVIPFLEFVAKYNQFVSNPINRKQLYKEQRQNLQTCLISSSSEGEEEVCLNTYGYLHYNPILIGVISNGDARYQDSILPLLSISKYINFCIVSEREGVQKPHYSIFDRARTKANQLSSYLGFNMDNKRTVLNSTNQPIPHHHGHTSSTSSTSSSTTTDSSTSTPTNDNLHKYGINHSETTPIVTHVHQHHNDSTSSTTMNQNSTDNTTINYEDFLHIGDSLNEDILGAMNANFDQVYLIRDKRHENLMSEYFQQQQLHTQQHNHNLSTPHTNTESNPSSSEQSKQQQLNIKSKEAILEVLDPQAIHNDYNAMQNIAQNRLEFLQRDQNIGHDVDVKLITTFRNLMQVRDAYFHDIIHKL